MEISKEQIRALLMERRLFASDAEIVSDDYEMMLDSLSLVWFLDGLQEKYGICLLLADDEWNEFRSVNGIHQLLGRKGAARKGVEPC
jgi:acyl carrier protein